MRLSIPKPRPTVWLPIAASTLFLSIYIPVTSNILQSTATAQTPIIHRQTAANSATTSAPIVTTATQATPPVPDCTPAGEINPSSPDLSGAAGLHINYEAPTYYRIYGNTAAQLRQQIMQCAPRSPGATLAEYTGETSYSLGWQYNTIVGANGCSLANVQVGVHIVTVLPAWDATANADIGLSGRWQQFAEALAVHEHGHAQLDANYGGLVLQRLSALGTMDCSAVDAQVQTTVDTAVKALNDANVSYDNQTNHGASQGAIIPTY